MHCGSTQTQFLGSFKRSSPFALEMSPSVAPSQLILFFTDLILNGEIREASKSGGGTQTSGGGHAGGTMPVPPWAGPNRARQGQPTSPTPRISPRTWLSKGDREGLVGEVGGAGGRGGGSSDMWLHHTNQEKKKQKKNKQNKNAAKCRCRLQLMSPPMAWINCNETHRLLMELAQKNKWIKNVTVREAKRMEISDCCT